LEKIKATLKDRWNHISLRGRRSEDDVKEKQGIDFRPYVILGPYDPPLAEQVYESGRENVVLLPRYVDYETEGGSVVEERYPEPALGTEETRTFCQSRVT
jgi:hypothetical protein